MPHIAIDADFDIIADTPLILLIHYVIDTQ